MGYHLNFKPEDAMNVIRTAGCAALITAVMLGCAGLATFQKLPGDQMDALFQDVQNNPTAYRTHQCPGLIVIEPKRENRSIELIGQGCREVDPHTATLSTGSIRTFRALLGKDGQPYAYASWNYRRVRVGAREVDHNTMRVAYTRAEGGGP